MKTLKSTIVALKSLGYSQERMAKIAKVSQMTISRWSRENPDRVDIKALNRLAKELEKSQRGNQ